LCLVSDDFMVDLLGFCAATVILGIFWEIGPMDEFVLSGCAGALPPWMYTRRRWSREPAAVLAEDRSTVRKRMGMCTANC
jgi:hypothetical protein